MQVNYTVEMFKGVLLIRDELSVQAEFKFWLNTIYLDVCLHAEHLGV